MRDQWDASATRGKPGGNGDIAAAGEGGIWPEAANMAHRLKKAHRHSAQIGQGFPGEIATQFAGADACEGESCLGDKLGFQPTLIAEIKNLGAILGLQYLSDGQCWVNMPPGSAA